MRLNSSLRGAPDRALALARYRRLAKGYDASAWALGPMRRKAVDLLGLREGDTVFDVGCGTGATLPELARRVGPPGRVFGIEQSPEMLAIARERLRREGIEHNATLIEAPAEEFAADAIADALLFFYTHDVLQSPDALARLFAHARAGARVVAAGARILPWWWGAPLNVWTALRVRRYLTTYRGLSRPWANLERRCPDFALVSRYFLGTAYIGAGTYAGPGRSVLGAAQANE